MKFLVLLTLLFSQSVMASPSTLDVKKRGEQEIRKVVEPVLSQYCHEQCQIIHIDTEVDVAIDDLTTPGFEDTGGKASLAPASGKLRLLMDDSLGANTRAKIVDLLKEHLEILNFPVDIESRITKFPQPASSGYRVADLRERVVRDIRSSLQNMLSQFCPETCLLGDFDVQTEVVNSEDINYSNSQDFYQDGPATIRVRGVKATIMTDQGMSPAQANGIIEMAKLKVAQFKSSTIVAQSMTFPKPSLGKAGSKNGVGGMGDGTNINDSTESKESKDLKEARELKEAKELRESKESRDTKNENVNRKESQSASDKKQEKIEKYEKIERVESGDAVQLVLEKFKIYGIVFSAIVLALLLTLVAISFRRQIRDRRASSPSKKFLGSGKNSGSNYPSDSGSNKSKSTEERAAQLARRIEAEGLFHELTQIFSEQPKVAKNVFTQVLTEEGVETTAQYLYIFGESVIMDLLRDPTLQSDLAELMDFYAHHTLEILDDERLLLLKKLHHRTVTAKMQVHGSRSAALFDFLMDMETPQIVEMVKNESNTVKAIVLTQCSAKKRNLLFSAHDEITRLKLMTELSRIDHLPKNYIYNVASALRRKKMENPKLNTEALPGTDVLVSFLEKADMLTQRTIVHQLLSSAGTDALQNLKSKLVSIETLRFLKDRQITEVLTSVKHAELIQFLKGCNLDVKNTVLGKIPSELSAELTEGMSLSENVTQESYIAIERKVLNRIKVLANNGQINITEVNERIFAEEFGFQKTG